MADTTPLAPLADATRTDTGIRHTKRSGWWTQARFGMFIHFGLYAIPARGEWVQWNEQIPVDEYAKLADQFNPAHGPQEWVDTAIDAGMKYMVLTSRHHDGFALFDSKAGDFNSVKTAAKRDIVAEYVKAVRKANLRVGIYYSPLDWRYPGYINPDLQRPSAVAMRRQYHTQMAELLSNYGPLDILWFDGGENAWLSFGGQWQGAKWIKREKGQPGNIQFTWEHEKVLAMMRRLQPNMIFNGRADMPADFACREGDAHLGDFDNQRPWELCATLATGGWGYKKNAKLKSLKECIGLLAKTAGRDGNLLLNVGPQPDGQIEPRQVERLHEIGRWMRKYGASIYDTRGGPFLPGGYGSSTQSDNTIYLHILQWPGEKLRLPPIPARILHASVMTGGAVTLSQSAGGIEISVPDAARNDMNTLIALELDKSAGDLKPVAVAEPPATGK